MRERRKGDLTLVVWGEGKRPRLPGVVRGPEGKGRIAGDKASQLGMMGRFPNLFEGPVGQDHPAVGEAPVGGQLVSLHIQLSAFM